MNFLKIALEIIKNHKYEAVGVRSLCEDENYKEGDYTRDSYEWDLEEDCSTYYTTKETTNGTCATEIIISDWISEDDAPELAEKIKLALKNNEMYGGKQVILSGKATPKDTQLDEGEIRIKNAKVIATI